MVGIYKITNNKNGKVYIGQSISIENRWKTHRTAPFNANSSQYSSPLYRAIRKYGLSEFSFEVLEECAINTLDEREKYYIQLYRAGDSDYGYNLTYGGSCGIVNTLLTPE